MATVSPPRIATFAGQTTINWSDATTPFSGFFLFVLTQPSDGTTPWAEINYGGISSELQLPLFTKIPVANGIPNTSSGVFYNTDIMPPGTNYKVYAYDQGNRQIAGPTAAFSITSAPLVWGGNVPSLTLTIPSTVPGAAPTPDS